MLCLIVSIADVTTTSALSTTESMLMTSVTSVPTTDETVTNNLTTGEPATRGLLCYFFHQKFVLGHSHLKSAHKNNNLHFSNIKIFFTTLTL
jgi:hypothetical protein